MAGISDASRRANGSVLSEIRFRRLASSAVIRLRIYMRLLRIVFENYQLNGLFSCVMVHRRR